MAGRHEGHVQPPASVLVASDTGMQEYTYAVVEPDERGVPQNLTMDTEYALLTEEQSRRYWTDPETRILVRDRERYPGAFAVRFTASDSEPETIVESLDRLTHIASIEQAAMTGE